MHLACRTTGPTSSGALDRRGVETPNLRVPQNNFIHFGIAHEVQIPKKKPSYIGCYGCPPFRSIVQKLLFHIEVWSETRESQLSSRKWSPWKICEGFCHISTIYAVHPCVPNAFSANLSQTPETKSLVGWPLLSASSKKKDNGVDAVSQTQEQPIWNCKKCTFAEWDGGGPAVVSTLRNIFLAIPTWDNMGRSQTYGPKNMGMLIFPGKPMYLGMSRKLREIDVLFIRCTPVPQPPKHLDAGASPAQDFARSQVKLNSFVRVAPDTVM